MRRALAIVVLVPALAFADAASEAALHFQMGSELYRQRRFAEALEHFIASNRLVPNANVVFNVAQTYGLMQRELEAYNWTQTYLAFDTLDEAGLERGRKAAAALASKVAVIDVATSAKGAELFVDRVDLGSVGLSPRKLALPAGEHTVIARLAGFREARATAAAVVGSVVPVSLELSRLTGRLVVTSEPPGASVVRADSGEVLGQTPLTVELPIAELRVAVRREGYVEVERGASIRDGAETRVSVTLQREASRVAVLTVQGQPEGARVRLDGREVGTVPLTLGGLEPGTRELSVESNGCTAWRTPALLEPGAATRATVKLACERDDRFRFLRWAGYGLGAASLLVGGITGLAAIDARGRYWDEPSAAARSTALTLNGVADVLMLSGAVVLLATLAVDQLLLPAPRTKGELSVSR